MSLYTKPYELHRVVKAFAGTLRTELFVGAKPPPRIHTSWDHTAKASRPSFTQVRGKVVAREDALDAWGTEGVNKEYIYSPLDNEFVLEKGVPLDHIEPYELLLQRIKALLKFVNHKDSQDFMQRLIAQESGMSDVFIQVSRGGKRVWFLTDYAKQIIYNNLENLWLLPTRWNSSKGKKAPKNWFKKVFGEAFTDYCGGKDANQNGLIFSRVMTPAESSGAEQVYINGFKATLHAGQGRSWGCTVKGWVERTDGPKMRALRVFQEGVANPVHGKAETAPESPARRQRFFERLERDNKEIGEYVKEVMKDSSSESSTSSGVSELRRNRDKLIKKKRKEVKAQFRFVRNSLKKFKSYFDSKDAYRKFKKHIGDKMGADEINFKNFKSSVESLMLCLKNQPQRDYQRELEQILIAATQLDPAEDFRFRKRPRYFDGASGAGSVSQEVFSEVPPSNQGLVAARVQHYEAGAGGFSPKGPGV